MKILNPFGNFKHFACFAMSMEEKKLGTLVVVYGLALLPALAMLSWLLFGFEDGL